MRRAAAIAAFAALTLLAGCASSAPYTVGSAVLNSALALGTSAASRASGDCYAVCTNGRVCNRQTGMCERPAEVKCIGPNLQSTACVREAAELNQAQPSDLTIHDRSLLPGGGSTPAGLGISPATGQAPTPPHEASPRPP